MKLKLTIVAILLVFSATGYFLYQAVIKPRYAAPQGAENIQPSSSSKIDNPETSTNSDIPSDDISDESQDTTADDEISDEEIVIEDSTDEPDNSTTIDDSYLEITKQDCTSRCKNYAADEEDLKYCQEICGLAKPTVADCDTLEDLEMDYCLKDDAIAKNDPTICDQIVDSNIKKACRSRLIEDEFEQIAPKDSNNLPY